MRMLDAKWKLYIFHSDQNHYLIKDLDGTKVKIKGDISRHDYSGLLCTEHFWNYIPHEKILIFQHDSMLLRTGIEEFLTWDWIGAPSWYGGYNGGLSLRSRSKMVGVIKRFKHRGEAEDHYFDSHVGRVGGRVAPENIASKFACESYFKLGTLGYHGIHHFLSPMQRRRVKLQYQIRDIKVL